MQKEYDHFTRKKARIIVVAPHDSDRVKSYWTEHNLSYTGVPDQKGIIAKIYGQQWKLLRLGRMPALFVIDRNGKIVFAHYAESMSDIPSNSKVLEIIDTTS